MVWRTTTAITNNSMLDYIWSNQAKYNQTAEEVSTQKKLLNPSDNPADAISVLSVNKELNQQNGYLQNMTMGQNELNVLDNTLASVTTNLQRANDLGVQASNGTMSAENLKNYKSEVDQILNSVVDLSNTKFNDNSIFAGTNVSQTTYIKDAAGNITYQGTPQTGQYQRNIEISDGVKVAINTTGDQVFGSYDAATGTGSGIMKTLSDFSKALSVVPPDYDAIRANLDNIQKGIDTVSNVRTNFASTTQRFEMTKASINTSVVQLKSYRSDLQDVDLSQAVTELTAQELALKATMSVASKTLSSTNLMDYM